MSHSWWRNTQKAQPGKHSRRMNSFQPQLEATWKKASSRDPDGDQRRRQRKRRLHSARPSWMPITRRRTQGQNTIDFNVGGGGTLQIISPASPLPALTNPAGIILDGTSEPGYSANPLIELNGMLLVAANGLVITGGNSTVKGLAIDNFAVTSGGVGGARVWRRCTPVTTPSRPISSAPMRPAPSRSATTTASTRPPGPPTTPSAERRPPRATSFPATRSSASCSRAAAPAATCSKATSSAPTPPARPPCPTPSTAWSSTPALSGNTIGGTEATAGNVISGNARFGVYLLGSGTTGNVLYRNIIGLNATEHGDTPSIGVDGVAILGAPRAIASAAPWAA